MEPVLSIVIPTFGAPESTEKTVRHLLGFHNVDIEILVLDNDPTGEQIGNRFDDIKDERFSYYRNETNIGRSNNIVRAIELSKADYSMLCSSEDIICQEGVDAVLRQIKETRNAAVIMGHVLTTENHLAFRAVEPGVYSKGFCALNAIPFLGNLLPLVFRKDCLPFEELYDTKESYMQHRLLLLAVGCGDYVYIDAVIGIIQDNGTFFESKRFKEREETQIDMSSFDFGECYYSPQSRAAQLISDLSILDRYRFRQDKKLLLIDKHVGYKVSDVVEYVYSCRDPLMINEGQHVGFLSADESLEIFENLVKSYFEDKEKQGCYFYQGRLYDKIRNELLLIREGERIYQKIQSSSNVRVCECGEKSSRLIDVLKTLDIHAEILNANTRNSEPNGIVLVANVYDEDLEKQLNSFGWEEVIFMDLMDKYLAVAWCHYNPSSGTVVRRIL